MKRLLFIAVFVLSGLVALGAYVLQQPRSVHLTGHTMGTTYSVKASFPRKISEDTLQRAADDMLIKFNKVFSTYDPDSDLSQFNQSKLGLPAPKQLAEVFVLGEQLYQWTLGSWDGTVKPLVDLWGFGHAPSTLRVPPYEDIQAALKKVGYHTITLSGTTLTKRHPDVTLDLSSIAKGYAVDQLASLLQEMGGTHLFIEIGGEVLAVGNKPNGSPWKVGINTPAAHANQQDVFTVVPLHNMALATSGDYRNFFEFDGDTYSHIINPKTGYPVRHRIVSVSVLAPQCAIADALATSIMVMGTTNGLRLLNRLDNIEGMIIEQDKDGGLSLLYSDYFKEKTLPLIP